MATWVTCEGAWVTSEIICIVAQDYGIDLTQVLALDAVGLGFNLKTTGSSTLAFEHQSKLLNTQEDSVPLVELRCIAQALQVGRIHSIVQYDSSTALAGHTSLHAQCTLPICITSH